MKFAKILCLATLAIVGCDDAPTNSDEVQKKEQERLNRESNAQVGMPAITNFQEKRMLKQILELRDTEIKTTTYIVDMGGRLHKVCSSIGFGFPYATQYTNPLKIADHYQGGYAILPQADPNGLFSPASADGTWVMCFNKATKQVSPVFIEPRIIVSPFELEVE